MRTSDSGPATNLVYCLPSILEPIRPEALFPKAQPLEVELGCGDAGFLVQYAQRHLDHNFIGVERLLGRIRKLDRKGRRAGLENLRGIRIESAYFLGYLLPGNSAAALHIYFPDPWPKRKHAKNRLIDAQFPGLARRALSPGGVVYLRTDDRKYFEQMLESFAASSAFAPVDTPAELGEVKTDFELVFQKRGISTLLAAYKLK